MRQQVKYTAVAYLYKTDMPKQLALVYALACMCKI